MSRNRIVLFLLMLLQAITLHAQDYEKYDTYNDSQKEDIYTEQFDKVDTTNVGWMRNCTGKTFSVNGIRDGLLTVKTMVSPDSTVFYGMPLVFDYSRNFEIEFKVRLDKDKPFKKYGAFYWGQDTNKIGKNGQHFIFHTDGCYQMIFVYSDDVNDKSRERCKFEKNGNFIVYTIRKLGYEYYVFVNHRFSHSYPYTKLSGQTIGIVGRGETTLEFDWIRISYLPKK